MSCGSTGLHGPCAWRLAIERLDPDHADSQCSMDAWLHVQTENLGAAPPLQPACSKGSRHALADLDMSVSDDLLSTQP